MRVEYQPETDKYDVTLTFDSAFMAENWLVYEGWSRVEAEDEVRRAYDKAYPHDLVPFTDLVDYGLKQAGPNTRATVVRTLMYAYFAAYQRELPLAQAAKFCRSRAGWRERYGNA